jgi:uncharacterized protein (DUF488 family)
LTQARIFTVGHSTHPIDHFVGLLAQHGITALADVRSSPYSRMNPQYNRETLIKTLREVGIAYVFLGRELGARSEDPTCYERGQVKYDRIAETDSFRQGLERVVTGAGIHRVALMCAEKEPLDCHRTVLVCKALVAKGTQVEHILADGTLEPHEATMRRLLELWGLSEPDMFRSPEQLLNEALSRQEDRIAYVDDAQADDCK